MCRFTEAAVAFFCVALSPVAFALYVPIDVDNVPVDRVVANLEKQIAADPKNVQLVINLARVHAMAFAHKTSTIPRGRGRMGRGTEIVPWVNYGVPVHLQFQVRSTDDAKAQAAARAQLDKAIARYRHALELAPDDLVATLGLGWTLVQANEKIEATKIKGKSVTNGKTVGEQDERGVRKIHWCVASQEAPGRRLINSPSVARIAVLMLPLVSDRGARGVRDRQAGESHRERGGQAGAGGRAGDEGMSDMCPTISIKARRCPNYTSELAA